MDFAVDLTYVDTYRLKGREPNKHMVCQKRRGLYRPYDSGLNFNP